MPKNSKYIYQFKITLEDIEPRIWRRIQVPQHYTFWDFHVAIQDAMGWLDCHLHQFEIFNPETSQRDTIGIYMDDIWDEGEAPLPGWKIPIAPYFSLSNKGATYEYDFGDGWEHQIRLENILPAEPGVTYPKCIDGEQACPPEDCGGVWGYEDLLEIIRNPEHEEYEEHMKWLGGHFDPEYFKPEEVKFDDPKKRFKLMMKN